MNRKGLFAIAAVICAGVASATSTPAGWTDDFEAAKKQAAAEDKLLLDLMYIENQSTLLDLKLMLLTIRTVFQKESTEGFDSERAKEMHDADCK